MKSFRNIVIACFLIISLTFASVANAIIFVPALVANYFGMTTASIVGAEVSIALHAGVIYLLMRNNNNPTSGETSDVQVNLVTNVSRLTPSGWNSPVFPSTEPTAPSSYTPSLPPLQYYIGPQWPKTFNNKLLACESYASEQGANFTHLDGSMCRGTISNTTWSALVSEYQPALKCNDGYTLNGNTCILTDESKVQKPSDGICQITRVGNTFSNDSRDPDCADSSNPINTQGSKIDIKPNTITGEHSDGSKTSITINPDGSITYKSEKPNSSTAKTDTNQVDFNEDGTVKGTFKGEKSGTGSLQQQGSGTGSNIEFPTDYNRESTQAQVEKNTKDTEKNTKEIETELKKQFAKNEGNDSDIGKTDQDGFANFDGSKYDRFDGEKSKISGAFTGLASKLGIPSGGQCGNAYMPMNILGYQEVLHFEEMCNAIEPIINYLFWTLCLIFVFREFNNLRI